jgi:hypothetical protein
MIVATIPRYIKKTDSVNRFPLNFEAARTCHMWTFKVRKLKRHPLKAECQEKKLLHLPLRGIFKKRVC